MIEIGQPKDCAAVTGSRFFGTMLAASRATAWIPHNPPAGEGHWIACALAMLRTLYSETLKSLGYGVISQTTPAPTVPPAIVVP
jgi:hypothetical protein